MSLSRSRVRQLRSAGWTVVEDGPLVDLRRRLLAVVRTLGRRRAGPLEAAGLVLHMPRRGSSW